MRTRGSRRSRSFGSARHVRSNENQPRRNEEGEERTEEIDVSPNLRGSNERRGNCPSHRGRFVGRHIHDWWSHLYPDWEFLMTDREKTSQHKGTKDQRDKGRKRKRGREAALTLQCFATLPL